MDCFKYFRLLQARNHQFSLYLSYQLEIYWLVLNLDVLFSYYECMIILIKCLVLILSLHHSVN